MSNLQPITCRAAVLRREGEPLTIENVIIDAPRGDQIRVRMISAGICASDAHFVWGTSKVGEMPGMSLPCVLGHEGAGVVESVGESVDASMFAVGDHVLTTFVPSCRGDECERCRRSFGNLCETQNLVILGAIPNKRFAAADKNGESLCSFVGLGVYSEYVTLRKSQAVKINRNINLEHACVMSCAVGTGFYAATKQAAVRAGTTAAVWGLGAIGLNAIFGCKMAGAKNIIGIDINSGKRDIALKFGCTEFVNPLELKPIKDGDDKPESVDQYLQRKYPGGVDYAFDCIGNQAVIDAGLRSLSTFGTLALVGLPPAGVSVNYPVAELLTGRTIVGAYFGGERFDRALERLTAMYADGSYPIDSLISQKYPLESINDAFRALKDGACIRSLIVFPRK